MVRHHSSLRKVLWKGRLALVTALPRTQTNGPVHVVIDATGLKGYGAGEWLVEKHGPWTRRSWRKLHIGRDADTSQIGAAVLTTNDVDNGSQGRDPCWTRQQDPWPCSPAMARWFLQARQVLLPPPRSLHR